MAAYETIIQSEDAIDLVSRGLLTKASNGMRQASSSTILSNFTYSSSSNHSGYGSDCQIDIPEVLISRETYLFLGFTAAVASSLWQRWERFPSDGKAHQGPYSFLDIAEYHIRDIEEDALNDSHDWVKCLQNYGLASELQEKIMSPDYHDLRLTESAKFWAIDSVGLRFRALEELGERSRERQRELLRVRTQRRPGAAYAPPAPAPIVESVPSFTHFTPGHTTLWKGIDRSRTKGAIDANTGELSIEVLASSWPSDFKGSQGCMLYFALQKEIADRYNDFVKHRSIMSVPCLVLLKVPNSLVAALSPYILQLGDEWKEVVWTCRQGKRLPRHLRHINSKPLLVGHICKNHDRAIRDLSSWTELGERNIMRLDKNNPSSECATQYVFQGDSTVDRLNEEAHLELLDPTSGRDGNNNQGIGESGMEEGEAEKNDGERKEKENAGES